MDAVIVDSNTLRAVGLRHILEERHALDTIIAGDPTALADIIGESTMFFVTPEAFASQPMFYVPRREHVVLISEITHSPLPVINPSATEDELASAIESVVRRLSASGASSPQMPLTEREREVLRHIAMGQINKEIVASLGISFNTVLTHRRNIMDKLGMRSVPALSMYAVMNGLVSQNEI